MEDQIPPNANLEERDPAAPEAGTARPANESASSAGAETGTAPDAEPEVLLANEGGTPVSSSVERKPEREALTPP
jgi:hypothetical protein